MLDSRPARPPRAIARDPRVKMLRKFLLFMSTVFILLASLLGLI
jgi:hypothetical protein